MKLSACLMVRDEEKNLARALDSLVGAVDEVVVMDTGSRDRTVEIAEGRGARVLRCEWEDDFAGPRNVLWEAARGEWMLWLDGDESLVRESIPILRRCAERRDLGAFYILRREILDEAAPEQFSEMMMLRLHRRDLPTRFVGRYHSQIVTPGRDCERGKFWMAGRSEVRIQHWRYKADNLLRARRGARIMAKELEEEPGNLYLMIELANAWSDLGDDRAKELRREIAKRLRPTDEFPPTVASVYTLDHLITHPAEAAEVGMSLADLRELCGKWFPGSAPLKWAIAQRLFAEADYEEAGRELEELLGMLRKDELDRLVPFDMRVHEDAEFNLGVCWTRLGRLDEAEGIFRRLVGSMKRGEGARSNLEVIAGLRRMREE